MNTVTVKGLAQSSTVVCCPNSVLNKNDIFSHSTSICDGTVILTRRQIQDLFTPQ